MADFDNGLSVVGEAVVDGFSVNADSIGLTEIQLVAAGYVKLPAITKTQIGLPNVDNTTDIGKPVSSSLRTYIQKEKEYTNSESKTLHVGNVIATFLDFPSDHTDNGAWVNRCHDKSWYNEPLGGDRWIEPQSTIAAAWLAAGSAKDAVFQASATSGAITIGKFYSTLTSTTVTEVFRGIKKEYPKAGVLWLAETRRVVGYDLESNSMWMSILGGSDYAINLYIGSITSIAALNGYLVVGTSGRGVSIFRFINDNVIVGGGSSTISLVSGTLAAARTPSTISVYGSTFTRTHFATLSSQEINSIDLTVVPGTPIDITTGIQKPTIAVATNNGVSIINSDDTVVILSYVVGANNQSKFVQFLSEGGIGWASRSVTSGYGYFQIKNKIPSANDNTLPDRHYNGTLVGSGSTYLNLLGIGTTGITACVGQTNLAFGTNLGLSIYKENPVAPAKGMVAHVTDSYSTGWMVGANKLTCLTGALTSENLLINGSFDKDSTGWTSQNGSALSVNQGILTITGNNVNVWPLAYQTPVLVIGKTYVLKFDILTAGTNGVHIIGQSVISPMTGSEYYYPAAIGSYTVTFTAETTSPQIRLVTSSAAGSTGQFDNVSLILAENYTVTAPEIVVNGLAPVSTAGWTVVINGVTNTATVNSGEFVITKNEDGDPRIIQNVTLVIGKTYRYKATFRVSGDVIGYLYSVTTGFLNVSSTVDTEITTDFVATSTAFTVYMAAGGGATKLGTVYVSKVSLVLIEPDNSVNNKGLSIVGTISKAEAAFGSNVMLYSNFTGSNYFEQSYNSELNFGTGDFYVCWWEHVNNITDQQLRFQRAVKGGSIVLRASVESDTFYRFYINGIPITSSKPQKTGLSLICWTRENSVLKLYVDDILVYSVTRTDNIVGVDSILRIGTDTGNTPAWTGPKMALFRIGASAISKEQIIKMYHDELKLFQPGAKCVLSGSQRAVTILSQDVTSDLLHVHSSWGRSTFKNLLRVSSEASVTGTPVSFSAKNGALVSGDTQVYISKPTTYLKDQLSVKPSSNIKKAIFPFNYSATASQTVFPVPIGYTVISLLKNGMPVRESTAGTFWTRSFDGYQEYVTLSSACVVNDWIAMDCVIKN